MMAAERKQGAIMNQRLNIVARCLGLVLLLSVAELLAQAQTQNPQISPAEDTQTQNQAQTNQPNPIPDLGPLNLTPDQVQKIKIIYADTKDQRQAVNIRIRQAQRSLVFFFQAEDGIRDLIVTGVQTCALPISQVPRPPRINIEGDRADGHH